MKRIDEIIIRYFKAGEELNDIIKELAEGDWSKADLIYNNNERFRELFSELQNASREYNYETSTGSIYSFSNVLLPVVELLGKSSIGKGSYKGTTIGRFFEDIRNEREDQIESGDIEDHEIVKRLDYLFKLPNYDPDAWLKRKFLLKGVYVSSGVENIPKNVIEGFTEACTCFIYGNFLATCAMTRSVLELILKDRFQNFSDYSLNDMINNWDKIDKKLKHNKAYRDKAKSIQRAGNASLHEGNDNVRYIFNEMTAQATLSDLKDLIEFIYK